jgi:hypothetical protein
LLQLCRTGLTVVLNWCYSDVTLVLQWRNQADHPWRPSVVTLVSQKC